MTILVEDPAPLTAREERRATACRVFLWGLVGLTALAIAAAAVESCRPARAIEPAPDLVSRADALAAHIQAEEVQLGLAAWLWDTAPTNLKRSEAVEIWSIAHRRLSELETLRNAGQGARLETAHPVFRPVASEVSRPGAVRSGGAGRSPLPQHPRR